MSSFPPDPTVHGRTEGTGRRWQAALILACVALGVLVGFAASSVPGCVP